MQRMLGRPRGSASNQITWEKKVETELVGALDPPGPTVLFKSFQQAHFTDKNTKAGEVMLKLF